MKRANHEILVEEPDSDETKELMEQVKELKGIVLAIHELIYQLEHLNEMLEPHTGTVYESEKYLLRTLETWASK
jgi:hypothetical protein